MKLEVGDVVRLEADEQVPVRFDIKSFIIVFIAECFLTVFLIVVS